MREAFEAWWRTYWKPHAIPVMNEAFKEIALSGWQAATAPARAIVAQQAEDEGLWFAAQTAPEAYLQQELRRLHAAIEGRESLAKNTLPCCF